MVCKLTDPFNWQSLFYLSVIISRTLPRVHKGHPAASFSSLSVMFDYAVTRYLIQQHMYIWIYLCECTPNFPQLIRLKSQLALALGWRDPPSVQERSERVLLRIIERPIMRRHIRMQQSANPIIKALSIRETYNTLHHSTHLISFSSRSASHPSPSSPSGPYGVGSVSSRTITGNIPCARTARSVSGAVSVDVGSATIDAWELGCTVAPDCAGSLRILAPGARVVAAGEE